MGASNGAAGRASASMMAKFAAFAVDINGTALARYDLTATERKRQSRKPGSTLSGIKSSRFGPTTIVARLVRK